MTVVGDLPSEDEKFERFIWPLWKVMKGLPGHHPDQPWDVGAD